ncbi:type II toxin-antitoxin system RelB/DinJ family antitoxin [Lentilactobacillus kisonensis]|uniref:Addiction module antitoxin, RelB DinJ family n=1 Tax=Lentilactobacillus kisonensis DSM 19906 = JCM 15041 TaxID=1423766 RepID=A0A0R1NVC7_9LACO|nr:type II toxin-antitoxin system RelB/DinJ family antitoxin [Lentilactobacillus kisonensis]KRL20328.1 hypothetical protein FC98_GL001740 [Lentilactobacillus kisonensis DSM 19906 = JCM 15041]
MARIEARIDSDVKNKAKTVLEAHGLTISDFIRMTLTTVANEGLPKYYSIPNRELIDSLQEVIHDLAGKKELPGADNLDELEKLLNSQNNGSESRG